MSHSNHGGGKAGSSSVSINEGVIGSFTPAKLFNYHSEASITSLDFHTSGQYLISAGIDKSIQLYDVHRGVHHKDIQSQKYGAHLAVFAHQELNCLYASTPNTSLDVDHSIRYLSLASNTYLRYFKGHKEQVTCLEMDPINDMFLSSSLDRTVKLWDLKSSSPAGNIDVGQPSVVAFDSQGIVFAVGLYPDPQSRNSKGTLSLYDVKKFDKGPFLSVDVPTIPGQTWNKLEFANNGKTLLISTDTHEHYVIDAFSGQLLTTVIADVTRTGREYHGDWMSFKYPSTGSSCFSPCGKFVLVGTPRGKVCTFDLTTLKTTEGGKHTVKDTDNPRRSVPFKTLETEGGIPKIVTFNPKLLTFATADNKVTLWQPQLF